ncbi:Hyaluronan / mRNA binding family [Plasmodiophora brassicae]
MPSMYGVAVANAFSLLDDDEPASVPVKADVAEEQAPAPAASTAATSKKPAGGRPAGGPGQRRGGQAAHSDRRQGHGNRPPKREYDRRSGTGRDPNVKRHGKGAHNWGDVADERQEPAAAAAAEPTATPEAAEDVPAEAPEQEQNKEEPEPEVEPEPEQLSLEEYYKAQEALRVEEDKKLNIRKVERDANERELDLPDEDADESGLFAGDEKKGGQSKKAAGKKKPTTVSLDEFTKDAAKARRGGGAPRGAGRGAFRGGERGQSRGGERGRGRGGRGGAAGPGERPFVRRSPPATTTTGQVNIDDQSAFPSLAPISAK